MNLEAKHCADVWHKTRSAEVHSVQLRQFILALVYALLQLIYMTLCMCMPLAAQRNSPMCAP